MPELPERVARVETRLEDVERDVAHLLAEVDTGEGLGARLPLRSRVHNLESTDAAARAAEAALSAVKAERRAQTAEGIQRFALQLTAVNIVVSIGGAVLFRLLG